MLAAFTRLLPARRFARGYFALTLLLVAIEAFIALAVDDAFVRPLLGDTLAVIGLYAAALSVFDLPRIPAAWAAFAFGCAVELAQGLRLLHRLGLDHIPAARVVFGTVCDVRDFFAYAAAVPIILLAERALRSRGTLRIESR